MKALLLLLLLALGACAADASGDANWRGTVKRDGDPPLSLIGFDPFPVQGFDFGGGIATMGYLDDNGGKLLAEVILQFAGPDDFERTKSQAFPITLNLKDVFIGGDAGMGIDYFEQPASKAGSGSQEQTFHHEFDQHQANTVSGTFTVTACDYTTFMDGHLQATVMDPSRGATRILDFQVHYSDNK